MSDNYATYITPSGHKMLVRTSKFANCSDDLIIREQWMENVYRLDPQTLGGTRLIVDIGCNIGGFAIFACSCEPNVRVVGFEPEEENYRMLCRNVEENGLGTRIEAHRYAVGKATGEVTVNAFQAGTWVDGQPSIHAGTAQIVPNQGGSRVLDTIEVKPKGYAPKCETVPCITFKQALDMACGEGKGCDFLKMDCEWSEYDIIESANLEDMYRCKHIAIETHTIDEQRFGAFLAKLCRSHRIEVLGGHASGGYVWGTKL
jgi:FkbM family methyltransferase